MEGWQAERYHQPKLLHPNPIVPPPTEFALPTDVVAKMMADGIFATDEAVTADKEKQKHYEKLNEERYLKNVLSKSIPSTSHLMRTIAINIPLTSSCTSQELFPYENRSPASPLHSTMNEYGSNVYCDDPSGFLLSRRHLSRAVWTLQLTFTLEKRGNRDEVFDRLNTWSYGMSQVAEIGHRSVDIQAGDGAWRSMTMDDFREIYPKRITGSEWMDYASSIVWSPSEDCATVDVVIATDWNIYYALCPDFVSDQDRTYRQGRSKREEALGNHYTTLSQQLKLSVNVLSHEPRALDEIGIFLFSSYHVNLIAAKKELIDRLGKDGSCGNGRLDWEGFELVLESKSEAGIKVNVVAVRVWGAGLRDDGSLKPTGVEHAFLCLPNIPDENSGDSPITSRWKFMSTTRALAKASLERTLTSQRDYLEQRCTLNLQGANITDAFPPAMITEGVTNEWGSSIVKILLDSPIFFENYDGSPIPSPFLMCSPVGNSKTKYVFEFRSEALPIVRHNISIILSRMTAYLGHREASQIRMSININPAATSTQLTSQGRAGSSMTQELRKEIVEVCSEAATAAAMAHSVANNPSSTSDHNHLHVLNWLDRKSSKQSQQEIERIVEGTVKSTIAPLLKEISRMSGAAACMVDSVSEYERKLQVCMSDVHNIENTHDLTLMKAAVNEELKALGTLIQLPKKAEPGTVSELEIESSVILQRLSLLVEAIARMEQTLALTIPLRNVAGESFTPSAFVEMVQVLFRRIDDLERSSNETHLGNVNIQQSIAANVDRLGMAGSIIESFLEMGEDQSEMNTPPANNTEEKPVQREEAHHLSIGTGGSNPYKVSQPITSIANKHLPFAPETGAEEKEKPEVLELHDTSDEGDRPMPPSPDSSTSSKEDLNKLPYVQEVPCDDAPSNDMATKDLAMITPKEKMVNTTQSPVATPGVWIPLNRLTLGPGDVLPPTATSGLVGSDNMSPSFLTVLGVPQDVNMFRDKPRSGDWSPTIFTAKVGLRGIVPPTIAQCLLASTLSEYGDGCTHIRLISGIGKDEEGNYRFYGDDTIALTLAISTIKQCLIEWLPATSIFSIKAPQHHAPTDYPSRNLGQSLAAADVQQPHPQSTIETVGERKPTSQSRSDTDRTVSNETNETKANANDHPSSTDGVDQTGPEKKAAPRGRRIIKKIKRDN